MSQPMSQPKVVKTQPEQKQLVVSKSKLVERQEQQQLEHKKEFQQLKEEFPKIQKGVSEQHKIAPLSSGIVVIPVMTSNNIPLVNLVVKDELGGLICNIVEGENVLKVLVENLLDCERLIKVNYMLLLE